MKPEWMRRFYEQHGLWPIAGGNGDEDPPEPEGDDEEDDDKDPRIKELSDEAAKYRVRAKDAETRAETVATELQRARVELAVRRDAAKRDKPFADLDVVLKVLDVESIATDDDDNPVEVGTALDRLAERHPYLLAEQAAPIQRTNPSVGSPSGTSMNRDKNKGAGIDYEKLAKKYPVLARNRRR